MYGAFSRYPERLLEQLQVNAGVIAKLFDPATGEVRQVLGATANGISFDPNPTYEDYGADIDNVPANTWQLKRLVRVDPVVSGTFRTMTAGLARTLTPGATGQNVSVQSAYRYTKLTPGAALTRADFQDIWIVGDYTSKNTGADAGFIAIHLMNAASGTGLKWKTNKDGKADFAYEFHGHYDLTDPDVLPYEIYVRESLAPEGF